jgi:PKD repeat protein
MLKLLLLCILFCSTSAYAQLSGSYTICSSGCDYASFTDAVDDLNSNGISGPVDFSVSAGNYNESFTINSISGASSTNTITFNGTGAGTRIYDALSSYSYSGVVNLSYTSYVKFTNMTIEQTSTNYGAGAAVMVSGGDHNTFDHCTIKCPTISSYIYDIYALDEESSSYNTYTNNTITGGFYTMYLDGGYYGTDYGYDLVKNNTIVNGYNYILYAQGTTLNVYDGNYIDSLGYNYGYGVYSNDENGATYKNNDVAVVTNSNYGIWWITSPNYSTTSYDFNVYNNIVGPGSAGAVNGFVVEAFGYSVGKFNLKHNTIKLDITGTYSGCLDFETSSANQFSIKNNIFDNTNGGYAIYFTSPSAGDSIDGNDYYTIGSNPLAYYNGQVYNTITDLKAAAKAFGQEMHAQNIKPTYASAKSMRLSNSAPAPAGPYAGIPIDIDGNARCHIFATAGASESTYGRSKPTAKFFAPTTIYNGAPVTFYNSAKVTDPQFYKWYVDGKYVTDSLHLKTQLALYPSVTVSLVVTNCAGTDSFAQTFSVSYPTSAPNSDFISDKNAIKVNEVVSFTDLSDNGTSLWNWEISPDSTFSFGAKVPTYKYVYGDANSQNPRVQFLASGYYKVCLTASNILSGGKIGKGSTICKTDYIYVLPSINLGAASATNEPKGYLYDDGGPANNYYPTSTTTATRQGIVIDACADSTYLIFKSMDVECGYDYVKVYDGKDNTGTILSKCSGTTSAGYSGYGPGFTGGPSSSCPYTCLPNSKGTIDTFKAGKQMYVEMDMDNYGEYAGFEAYWWTKSRTEPKPKAGFTTSAAAHNDSICAGGVIGFNNTSTGDDLNYAWELDGDYSDGFETTTKNASWLWLFPADQQVTLITTNCGGPDTFTKTVHVFAPAAPVAGFKADNTNPTINDLVYLTSTVPQCVDDYKWTIIKTYASPTDTGQAQFAMGTSATNQNPVLMFTDTGYYTVNLFVDNGGGAAKDQITKKAYIYVKNGYCIPSVAQLNSGIGISNVSFNGIDNKSTQGDADYTNYVNDHSLSTTLELGVTYPITIQRDTPYYEAITRTIFIDWNRDGSFESNEVVAVDSNNTSAASWTAYIKVPKTASIGATVMRIAANRGSYTNQPCGQNQYGEYEDYRVYVRPDQTPPVIYLKGKDSMVLEQGYTYTEPGDSAVDNLDGVITANINVTTNKPNSFTTTGPALIPGDYIISYNVKDAAGNAAVTRHRYITVLQDTGRPNLVVSGPDTTFVLVNKASTGSVTLPVIVSSEDLVDGTTADTISPNIIPVNKLDTVKVMYSTADQNGNRAVVYRYVIIFDTIAPKLTLVGHETEFYEVNDTYVDSGVATSDNYYTASQLTGLVRTASNIDMTRPGVYKETYNLTDPSGNKAAQVIRTVIVGDTVAPVITLNGNKSDTIEVDSAYNDLEATVSDNFYTNLSIIKSGTFYSTFPNGVPNKLGTYTIIYSATDGSGNKASVTRFVTVVDRIAPVISLLGEPSISICRWADYKDSGYSVKDNYYATVKVDTEGTFISKGGTTIQGLYSLRYKATDGSGNVGYSDYRYILVRPADDQLCKTGIKEGLSLDKYINVYPNPTSGMLTITANLPTQERVVMTITNALGQTITTISNGNLGQNSFSVDLSGQAAGMYMLTIQSAHDKVTKQIMLTK